MAVDVEARPALHLSGDLGEPGVVELDGAAAAGADDVMVMGGFARDVRVLARGQVKAFHQPQVGEQLQRAEDRRAPDPKTASRGVIDQLARGEVAVPAGDQFRDGAPGLRAADAGSRQGVL